MVKHKVVTNDEKCKTSKWIEEKIKDLRKNENDKTMSNDINMRVLLGYLN